MGKKTKDQPNPLATKYGKDLYCRARRKLGMTDEMIGTYPDAVSLKMKLDAMSPQTDPDRRVKAHEVPAPPTFELNRPDVIEFESKLEMKFVTQNRSQFDESNLQAELRLVNRKYGRQDPVKIVATRTFKPVNGVTKDKLAAMFLVTHFRIFYKE